MGRLGKHTSKAAVIFSRDSEGGCNLSILPLPCSLVSCQRPQSTIDGPPIPSDFMGRSLSRHSNHKPRLSQCGLGPRLIAAWWLISQDSPQLAPTLAIAPVQAQLVPRTSWKPPSLQLQLPWLTPGAPCSLHHSSFSSRPWCGWPPGLPEARAHASYNSNWLP